MGNNRFRTFYFNLIHSIYVVPQTIVLLLCSIIIIITKKVLPADFPK